MNPRTRELFVAYLVVLLLLTFLPLDGLDNGQPVDLRLGLFRTINFAFRRGLESRQFVVLIGNIAAFVPLGVFVPLLLGRASIVRVFVIALALSTAIELGQLAVSIAVGYAYRTADVDDVLTNVLGALVGCVAFALYQWVSTAAAARRAG